MFQTLRGSAVLQKAFLLPAFTVFLLAVLSLSPPPAAARDINTISLEEAVDLALQNNLGLQSARIGTETKKRKVDTAWNVFVPTVDVSGTLARTNLVQSASGLFPDPSSPFGVSFSSYDLPQWSLSTQLSVSLNLNIALFEAMNSIRMDYQAGLLSYEAAKAQLERDVRKSYLQILLLKENIALMEENLASAERRVAMARDNYLAGLAPELSYLQAQVAAENLKPAIAEMKNGLETALAAFAMNLGLPLDVRLNLAAVYMPEFTDLDTEALISKAANGKPDLQELRHSILQLQTARKARSYQAYTPSISMAWTADPTFQGDPMDESWFKEDGWKQRSGMFRISLAYRLHSLFPFSADAQGIADIDDNIRQLNITLAQAVRGTEIEVYTTVLKLEKSRQSVEALRLNAELAERAYRLTEESYRAGITELLEVQNAELELRKARLEILKERYNYMNGLLDLEYAIGVPFGTLSRS